MVTSHRYFPHDPIGLGWRENPINKQFFPREDLPSDPKVIGGGLMALGTAMLIPGIVDAAFITGGVMLFRHPIGGVIGWVFYNTLAAGVWYVGYEMTQLDSF